MAKSDPLGGRRTQLRHGSELVGGMGLAVFVMTFIPDSILDPFQKNVGVGILTGVFSHTAKIWDEASITKRIITKVFGASIVLLMLSGCAGFAGRSTPHEFRGPNGETIVACEVAGIGFSFGDADICRNIEGGHVSEFFKDIVLGVTDTAMRIVGGVFAGIGGAGAAMSAPPPAPPAPVTVTPSPLTSEDIF